MELVKTRLQLINEAASKLQIVGDGQPLDAESEGKLDDKIDALLLQLASERIAEVANDEAIPSDWFDPIASLLANRARSDFGQQFDPGLDQYQKALLKKVVSGRPSYAVQEAEYF